MNWATLATLIVNYGLPLALKLAERWESKDVVTQQEIDALKKEAELAPKNIMLAALSKNGIDPESPEGQRLLSLVGLPVPEVRQRS